jgi:HK97 family phage portal protein
MAIFGLVTRKEHERTIRVQEDALKAQMDALKAELAPAWALATAEAEKFNLPNPEIYDNQAELFRRLSWVYAAVNAVANEAAVVPFSVAKRKPDEKEVDIPNHDFELLLDHPNPEDSRFEFLNATFGMKKLNGNAYWWLNREDEFAPPEELWFIPPSMIKPEPDGKLYIKGYRYFVGDGREIALEPWEIVHFRNFNPFSRFVGLSAIESIAIVAMGDLGMQEWNTKLFRENNAKLPGILAFAEMVPDTPWEDLKRQVVDASQKRQMMLLRGVGRGDVNYIQAGVSQKEMEFLNGRQSNKEEIWAVLAPGLSAEVGSVIESEL